MANTLSDIRFNMDTFFDVVTKSQDADTHNVRSYDYAQNDAILPCEEIEKKTRADQAPVVEQLTNFKKTFFNITGKALEDIKCKTLDEFFQLGSFYLKDKLSKDASHIVDSQITHQTDKEFNLLKRDFLQLMLNAPEWIYRGFAHKLGILAKIKPKNALQTINLEGVESIVSYQWIVDALQLHYLKLIKQNNDQAQQFAICFDAIQEAYARDSSATQLANVFQQKQDLCVIRAVWSNSDSGHAVGLAVLGNRLIYTNTGVGSEIFCGTVIATLKDVKLITPTFIRKIKNAQSQQEIHRLIHSVIKPLTEEPPVLIPSKPQKIGTCALSNPKKNIKGILACILAQKLFGELKNEYIEQCVPLANKIYKDFTKGMRDNALTDLIVLCKKEPTPELRHIVAQYCVQHADPKRKNGEDFARVNKLLKSLPPHFFPKVNLPLKDQHLFFSNLLLRTAKHKKRTDNYKLDRTNKLDHKTHEIFLREDNEKEGGISVKPIQQQYEIISIPNEQITLDANSRVQSTLSRQSVLSNRIKSY